MGRNESNPPWLRWVTIIASLACATTVWMAVKLTETTEQILEIPVVIARDVPEIDFSFEPAKVRVKFGYSSKDARLVHAGNFRVVVEIPETLIALDDLARREEGELRFATPLNRRMVEPFDPSLRTLIEPLEVLGAQTTWTARLRHQNAIIAPRITGTPAEGYDFVADSIEFDRSPEIIVVLNRQSEQQYGGSDSPPIEIHTEPIDITGLRDEQRVLIRLAPSQTARREPGPGPVSLVMPEGVRLLPRDSGQSREVTLRAVERQITREMENLPVTHVFLRQGLTATIEPDVINVVLRGPASAVREVTPEMLSIKLNDVVEQPGTSARVSVSARLVEGDLRPLINVRPEPASVSITVEAVEEPVVETPSPTPEPTPETIPDDESTS